MRTFDGVLTECSTASLLQVHDRTDNSKVLNLDRCQLNTIKYFRHSFVSINFVVILSLAKQGMLQEQNVVSWLANDVIIQRCFYVLQGLRAVFAISQIMES